MALATIKLVGRKGSKGPYGIINAFTGENISVQTGEKPLIWLRNLAQEQAFAWNRNYHPDWDFRVSEKGQ